MPNHGRYRLQRGEGLSSFMYDASMNSGADHGKVDRSPVEFLRKTLLLDDDDPILVSFPKLLCR